MSQQVENLEGCHLCGRPLVDGICLRCDRPHHSSVAGARARLWARDHRLAAIAGAVVVSVLAAVVFAVVRPSIGALPPTVVPPPANTVSTSPRPDGVLLSPSVFGVATGTMDEYGRRELRGLAFVVRSENHVTELLTDYGVVVDRYLSGQRTVELEQGDRIYTAEIAAVSPDPHVALLELNGTWDAMPVSSQPLAPGDQVDVYTSADIVEHGIVLTSGARRRAAVVSYGGRGGSAHLTFSDEVADQGSGAPVVDVNGMVVGIAESTSPFGPAAAGVGFAVPIAQACAAVAAC